MNVDALYHREICSLVNGCSIGYVHKPRDVRKERRLVKKISGGMYEAKLQAIEVISYQGRLIPRSTAPALKLVFGM